MVSLGNKPIMDFDFCFYGFCFLLEWLSNSAHVNYFTKLCTLFFTKMVTADIFPRTPVPVGISMLLTPSLQDWYVCLPVPTVGFRRNYYTYVFSTVRLLRCSKLGQNVVFLRRNKTWTELTIAKWKKARCRLAVDLNEFDGAPRAHYCLDINHIIIISSIIVLSISWSYYCFY